MKEQYDNYVKARPMLIKQRAARQLEELAQEIIAKLHSEVFRHTYHTPCKSCAKSWLIYMDDLERWYQGNIHIFGNAYEAISDLIEDVKEIPVKKKRVVSEETKAKIRATKARQKAEKLARDTKAK